MSNESQPEAKRQRIEEQDDHLTTTTAGTNTDRKMAEETSKMEAEATAEGEFLSCLGSDRIRGCRHVSFLADARADDMIEARKAEAEVRTWLARLCGFGCRGMILDSLFRGRPVCGLVAS